MASGYELGIGFTTNGHHDSVRRTRDLAADIDKLNHIDIGAYGYVNPGMVLPALAVATAALARPELRQII